MRSKSICLAFGLMFLSACATAPLPVGDEVPVANEADEPLVVASPQPEPGPASEPKLDPDNLLNKRPAEIVLLLGEPSLLRWEDKVQVFQYSSNECVLDLVFFEQLQGGFSLKYYESRTRLTGAAYETIPCLDATLKARAANQ